MRKNSPNRSTFALRPAESARRCGRDFAPLLCGFVRYVMESAAERGATRIHYFTREGDFFAALHNAIAERAASRWFPQSRLLPVSRLSTFVGTLRGASLEEFGRLWRLYPDQSVGGFLKSVALPAERVDSFLRDFNLNLDEPIARIGDDERIRRFLADSRVRAILEDHIRRKRALLEGFLGEQAIGPEVRQVFVADLGWAGTIQDNLSYLRPGTHFHGIYFGTARLDQGSPPNATRQCYLDDVLMPGAAEKVRRALLRAQPLEFLCNSPLGTVTGYTADEGRFRAVREPNSVENGVFETFTRFFQEGVFDRVEEFARDIPAGASAKERNDLRRLLIELLYDPPRRIADAYRGLWHDETFGRGGLKDAGSGIPLPLVLGSLWSGRSRRRLREWATATGWLPGVLVASGLRPLQKLLNRRRWGFLFDESGMKPAEPVSLRVNSSDVITHDLQNREETVRRAS